MKRPQTPLLKRKTFLGCVVLPLAILGVSLIVIVFNVYSMLNSSTPDHFPERDLFGITTPNFEHISNAGFEVSFSGPKTPTYFGEFSVPVSHQIPFEEAISKYDSLLSQRGWIVDNIDRENNFATWRNGERFLTITDGRGFRPEDVPDPNELLRIVIIMDVLTSSERLKKVFNR